MGAAQKIAEPLDGSEPLSAEMVEFVDHLADLLAAEFVRAMKEDNDESSGIREVFEREPTGAEHR